MGFFAGITTQIITITYFQNVIYHRQLALNWSISTSVAHTIENIIASSFNTQLLH